MVHISTAAGFLWSPYLASEGMRPILLAYLDPGSGSYLLQLLIAAALGGLLLLRLYWSKVKSFVRRLFTGQSEDVDVDE
jgi:hypothetical protein